MAIALRLPWHLSDGEIILDSFRPADAAPHFVGEDVEMRRRFEAPAPPTFERTRDVILRWAARPDPATVTYALRDRAGRLLGGCEARRTSEAVVEVSYWVFPDHRGQGRSARALVLLGDALAEMGELERVEAHVDADNHASRKAAERAGFACRGEVIDALLAGGEVTRLLFVRLLRRP